jgi:RNA polymerase sigma factor (TIGR02999 family)
MATAGVENGQKKSRNRAGRRRTRLPRGGNWWIIRTCPGGTGLPAQEQGAIDTPNDITRLLGEATAGDEVARDRLIPLVYAELRAIARRQLSRERADHTLTPTALVHEAYLKLAKLDRIEWQNRAHFFAIAARSMRNLLVDHAQRRNRQKRGGGVPNVPLEEALGLPGVDPDQVLALDSALKALEERNERHARIVEMRFFAGLTIEETADALEISPATVKRDWTLLRAWLARELGD